MVRYTETELAEMTCDLDEWSLRIGETIISIQLIGQSRYSVVYRVFTRTGSRILKISQANGAIQREVAIHRLLETSPLRIQVIPKVIAFDAEDINNTFVLFEDNLLVPVRWNSYLTRWAIDELILVHETNQQGFQLPEEACSHTPHWTHVFTNVINQNPTLTVKDVTRAGFSTNAKREILRLYKNVTSRKYTELRQHHDLTHGDFHLNNVMWSVANRCLYVIDWEFLHADTPYFDLFQMLDATSPTTKLVRPITRLKALRFYYERRFGRFSKRRNPPYVQTAKWIRSYLYYAALHLFWIAGLIQNDLDTGNFDAQQLLRQQRETYHGLLSVARDLRRMG